MPVCCQLHVTSTLNIAGRLGLGIEQSTSYNKPVKVNALPADVTPINIVCGSNSSVVLTQEGRTFCTGSNRCVSNWILFLCCSVSFFSSSIYSATSYTQWTPSDVARRVCCSTCSRIIKIFGNAWQPWLKLMNYITHQTTTLPHFNKITVHSPYNDPFPLHWGRVHKLTCLRKCCRDNKLGLDTVENEINETVYTFTEIKHPKLCENGSIQFSLGTLHSAVLTGMCVCACVCDVFICADAWMVNF